MEEKGLAEVCRHLEITESTWHRWVAQSGGMKANETEEAELRAGLVAQVFHRPASLGAGTKIARRADRQLNIFSSTPSPMAAPSRCRT